MTPEIFDFDQGTDDWHRARMGIPTASRFGTILAKGKDGGASVTRKEYLYRLAGEIITGEPTETYSNAHMERGHAMEPDARELYSFINDAPLLRVGFIRMGNKGCSPDSLVGSNGVLEIKTAMPHILIGAMMRDDCPPEHVAQCQGNLWIAEREWLDLCVYWPKMPLVHHRVTRDEAYIDRLSKAVDQFNEELAVTVEQIRARMA